MSALPPGAAREGSRQHRELERLCCRENDSSLKGNCQQEAGVRVKAGRWARCFVVGFQFEEETPSKVTL